MRTLRTRVGKWGLIFPLSSHCAPRHHRRPPDIGSFFQTSSSPLLPPFSPHPHPILDPPHPRFACRSDARFACRSNAHFLLRARYSAQDSGTVKRLVSAMLSRNNNANKHLITVEGRRKGVGRITTVGRPPSRSMPMGNQMSDLDQIQSLAHTHSLISPRLSAGTGYGASL